jgi:hypothetical protein
MMSRVSEAAREIDAIIGGFHDWRGETLASLRALILQAFSPLREEVKWKKPSNLAGVPVWSSDGIVCVGEGLKNAVRLTFPKGALIGDPKGLFNARLDSKTSRAIDIHKGETIDNAALAALIRDACKLNASKLRQR